MSYSTEFNEKVTVPEILLQLPWTDHSWHNNVCPSFHNEQLMVVVWVDFDDVKDREWDAEKKFTVQELIPRENDEPGIGALLFATDLGSSLKHWLALYEAHMHTEGALTAINNGIYIEESVADTLQTALDLIDEQMNNIK
jgi:hypothetical protein